MALQGLGPPIKLIQTQGEIPIWHLPLPKGENRPFLHQGTVMQRRLQLAEIHEVNHTLDKDELVPIIFQIGLIFSQDLAHFFRLDHELFGLGTLPVPAHTILFALFVQIHMLSPMRLKIPVPLAEI